MGPSRQDRARAADGNEFGHPEEHPYDGLPMASLSRDEVAHVAKLARLQLTDEQIDVFTPQLAAILEHAADVEALDLDAVLPTAHPYPLVNVVRPDVARDAGSATPC